MAIKLNELYPTKTTAPDADYPYGSARNQTAPGDGTGTPWEKSIVDDTQGFYQALLSTAGITPSGTPDKVGASQYLDAMRLLFGSSSISLANYYQSGDTKLSEAWARMITDIETAGSAASKCNRIILGKFPGDPSGIWPHDTPVNIPSGYTLSHGLVDWNNTNTGAVTKRVNGMFQAIGTSSETPVNITADITRGDNTLTVASTAGMAVGGYVNIVIENSTDQTTGMFPIIYTFVKIVALTATTITIKGIIDWDVSLAAQTTHTVQYFADEDVPKGIRVEDVYVVDSGSYVAHSPRETTNPEQPDYVIGPFYFQCVDDVQVRRVRGKHLKCPLVQMREYTDCLTEDCYSDYPLAIAAGEGYGVQMSRGQRGYQVRCGGYETRHVCDFTSSCDFAAIDCWDDTDPSEARTSFLMHGRYESRGIFERCKGTVMGLGAGFGFGNFMRDIHWNECKFDTFSGRGAIGICSMTNTDIKTLTGSLYFEQMTFDNVNAIAGDPVFRRETRLTTAIASNGITVKGRGTFRVNEVNNFNLFSVGPDVLVSFGGSSIGLVSIIDVKRVILDGEHDNKRYKLTGSCSELVLKNSAKLSSANFTTSGGFINVTDLTVSEFNASLSGILETSYVGASFNRPFLFEAGAGTNYTLNLHLSGLKCLGTWDESGRLMDNITLVGGASECIFEGTTAVNLYDVTTSTRQPFPSSFKCFNNYYADSTRNYDNSGHVWTQSVSATISAGDVVSIILTKPAWLDFAKTYHMTGTLAGGFATTVQVLNIFENGSNLVAKVWNSSGTTANLSDTIILQANII